ncbi:energy-coupled thiamine transporter ThiT [Eubacteriales bacterium OttesenSCG-928-G02]|nr:energy-coupled thiamine transporter ThiT [Eubacteriales bacterium OttesenSCG-928-G02]
MNLQETRKLKNFEHIVTLVECGVFVGLAAVLSELKIFENVLGGSITLLSMFPIILISFRHGVKWGVGSAFAYSIIQLIFGFDNFAYVPTTAGVVMSILFDYILPFTALGLAGIINIKKNDTTKTQLLKVVVGTVSVILLRYIFHVISGAVIWHEINIVLGWDENALTRGPLLFSLLYNLSYMGPDSIPVILLSPLLVKLRTVMNNKINN